MIRAGAQWIASVMGVMIAGGPALADQASDDCSNVAGDWNRKIAGCTTILNRGSKDLNLASKETAANKASRWIAFNNRGSAYIEKKDYDRAIEDLNEALKLNPNSAEISSNFGWVYIEKKDYDKAIENLNKAVKLNPKSAYAFNSRGLAYHRKGDYEQAIKDLDKAIALDRTLPNPHRHRGNAFREMGDLEQAIRGYDAAVVLNPKYLEAIADRAAAYAGKGDLRKALDDYMAAEAIDGSYAPAREGRERTAKALEPPEKKPDSDPSAPISTPVKEGRRIALVIGNAAYRHVRRLVNPLNDAADIAAALEPLGFEVITSFDATREGMLDAINAFRLKLSDAKMALFFYAGHAIQVGETNHLLPIDAKVEAPLDLTERSINMQVVLRTMESKRRISVVILDACRDYPFEDSLSTAYRSAVGRGLAPMGTQGETFGTFIAFATQPKAVAQDGLGARNSPFTAALLKHIRTPKLDVGILFRRVRAEVKANTDDYQVPWDHSSLVDEYVPLAAGQ